MRLVEGSRRLFVRSFGGTKVVHTVALGHSIALHLNSSLSVCGVLRVSYVCMIRMIERSKAKEDKGEDSVMGKGWRGKAQGPCRITFRPDSRQTKAGEEEEADGVELWGSWRREGGKRKASEANELSRGTVGKGARGKVLRGRLSFT